MLPDMRQQQFCDSVRDLIGSEVPDAGEDFELIRSGDEFVGALRCYTPDSVVGVAPNIKNRNTDCPKRATDRAAGAVPRQRTFHRCRVAEDADVPLDRGGWNAVFGEPFAQPTNIVRQHT